MADLSKFKRGITIRVTPEIWDELKGLAKKNDSAVTAEVERIINEYLHPAENKS